MLAVINVLSLVDVEEVHPKPVPLASPHPSHRPRVNILDVTSPTIPLATHIVRLVPVGGLTELHLADIAEGMSVVEAFLLANPDAPILAAFEEPDVITLQSLRMLHTLRLSLTFRRTRPEGVISMDLRSRHDLEHTWRNTLYILSTVASPFLSKVIFHIEVPYPATILRVHAETNSDPFPWDDVCARLESFDALENVEVKFSVERNTDPSVVNEYWDHLVLGLEGLFADGHRYSTDMYLQ